MLSTAELETTKSNPCSSGEKPKDPFAINVRLCYKCLLMSDTKLSELYPGFRAGVISDVLAAKGPFLIKKVAVTAQSPSLQNLRG